MRTLPFVVLMTVATAGSAFADDHGLSAQDVEHQLGPMSAQIESCYLERTADVRGAGHLDLVFTVSRYGIIENLTVKTPGLSAKLGKQIDSCIRETVEHVAFPARRASTTATVPYYFQHTAAPNAGPQLSCFSAAGCHTK